MPPLHDATPTHRTALKRVDENFSPQLSLVEGWACVLFARQAAPAPIPQQPQPQPVATPAPVPQTWWGAAPAPKFCGGCGKPLTPGAQFCGNCGRSIAATAQS